MTEQTHQWMTATEAAEHLRIATRTVLRWAKLGTIPAHRLSGCARITYRFSVAELDAFLRGEMETSK